VPRCRPLLRPHRRRLCIESSLMSFPVVGLRTSESPALPQTGSTGANPRRRDVRECGGRGWCHALSPADSPPRQREPRRRPGIH
jgi:hypothetical protein